MRYLLAVVIVLVFAACATAGPVYSYIGRYKSTEKILVPLNKAWDTSATGTTPRFRYGISTWNKPDSAHIVCRRAAASAGAIGTHTYKANSATWPFTGINVDTSLNYAAGDTVYWLNDSVGRLNGGTTIGCLSCQLTMYYKTSGAATFFTLNVDADSTIGNRATQRAHDGTGGVYLKVDSIVSTKVRIATAANATFPAVSISGDTAAGLSITSTTGPAMRLLPTTGAGLSIVPTTGTGISIAPSGAGVGFRINGSDTGLVVATSGSGKPAVAFRNTHATGAAGSNGFYVSSTAREGVVFKAEHASSNSAWGLKLWSLSSQGGGLYATDLASTTSSYWEDITSGGDIRVGAVGSGAINSTSFGAGSITASAFATATLKIIRDTILGTRYGRATSNASDSAFVSSDLTAVTDFYNGCMLYCFYGTGKGQSAFITKVTKTAANVDSITFSPKFTTAPAVNDSFAIFTSFRGVFGGVGRALKDSGIAHAAGVDSLREGTAQVGVKTMQDTVQTNIGTHAWATATRRLSDTIGIGSLAAQATATAIKAKTDNLPASPAATGDAMTLTATERQNLADTIWYAGAGGHGTTRILTAGTNIVLAKGTGVTGFNDILASDVWAVATRRLTDTVGIGSLSSQAIALQIKAAVDTSIAAAGFKSTSSSTQGFSTDTDTLHIWWGPTELLKTLFWHVGKGPGSVEIDSTRVFWLP